MSDDLVLFTRRQSAVRWGGTAIGAVILNIFLLGFIFHPIASMTAYLATIFHWLWFGSVAGGAVFILLQSVVVWICTVSLGFVSVLLPSFIYGQHRQKAARISCYFGSPVWIIFAILSLICFPVTWASVLMAAAFSANAIGQLGAVLYLQRHGGGAESGEGIGAEADKQIKASPAVKAQLDEKISMILQATTLNEANIEAAQCLSLMPSKRMVTGDELAQLTQKLIELKKFDQAEALSALHFRLVDSQEIS